MRALILALVVLVATVSPVMAQDAGVALIEPMSAGSAAGSAAVPVAPVVASPSSALPNPATSPVAAWDEAKAARKTSWPLLVFALLVMLSKALAYGREALKGLPVVGKAAEWLSVGKRAMLVAGFATVGAAGYDVLMAGGSLVAALIAAGVAVAGALHSTTKGA